MKWVIIFSLGRKYIQEARFMKISSIAKFLIVFFFIFLTACTQISSSPEPTATAELLIQSTPTVELPIQHESITRWLSGTNCSLPCWEGIRPGQTSLNEVESSLKQAESIRITYNRNGTIEWQIPNVYNGVAYSENDDNVTQGVSIQFMDEQMMNIQEVIDAFGDPSFVQVLCSETCADANLIYPDKGMEIRLIPSAGLDDYSVQILENSQVYVVSFFVPGLDNYCAMEECQRIPLRKWEGYGSYQ